jgi:hypothetical protein
MTMQRLPTVGTLRSHMHLEFASGETPWLSDALSVQSGNDHQGDGRACIGTKENFAPPAHFRPKRTLLLPSRQFNRI